MSGATFELLLLSVLIVKLLFKRRFFELAELTA